MIFIEMPVKGQVFQIKAMEWKNQIWFHLNGRIFVLDKHIKDETPDPSSAHQRTEQISGQSSSQTTGQTTGQTEKHTGESFVVSPMPGQVVKVLAQPGMKVKENQTLVILSSMKMEYILKSEKNGVIKSVKTKEGETVLNNQVLVEISNDV